MKTLEETDRRIITLLNQNGRISNVEIARQPSSVSSRTVANRVEHLVDEGSIAVRAVVNPAALGCSVLEDVLIETAPGRLKEVGLQLADFEEITYAAFATGDRDISIQVAAKSNQPLFDFVTETLGNLPGVRRTRTHLLPAKIKDIDIWLPPKDS